MTDVYVPPSNTTLPTLSTPIEVIADDDIVTMTISYGPNRPTEAVFRRGQFLFPFLHSSRQGNTYTVIRDGGWPSDFEVFPDEVGGSGVSYDGPFVLASADGDLPNGRVIQGGTNITVTDGGPGGVITISATYAAPTAGGAPLNISRSAALAGTSTNYAREDHKHDVDTDVPVSVGTSNLEGTATTLARSDHQHSGSALIAGALSNSLPVAEIIGAGTAGTAGTEIGRAHV